jgi:DNA recombination protein RmuC
VLFRSLGHAGTLGSALDRAVGAYNQFVGSVDSRLLPTLRRFEEAGARSERTLTEPKAIESSTNQFRSLPEAGEDLRS